MIPDLSAILLAISLVESGGNPTARGKAGELGILQISAVMVEDCNRIQDHIFFHHSDALTPSRAEAMFRIYVSHYCTKARLGREPTAQDVARCWNGGPDGWNEAATLPYWEKVRDRLFQIANGKDAA